MIDLGTIKGADVRAVKISGRGWVLQYFNRRYDEWRESRDMDIAVMPVLVAEMLEELHDRACADRATRLRSDSLARSGFSLLPPVSSRGGRSTKKEGEK